MGWEGCKMPKNDPITNFNLSDSISQELQIISSRFLVHRCKIISPGVFPYFLKNYNIVNIKIIYIFYYPTLTVFFNKQLFFKFIKKCQTEILRCAPPFSHVYDFCNNIHFCNALIILIFRFPMLFLHIIIYDIL